MFEIKDLTKSTQVYGSDKVFVTLHKIEGDNLVVEIREDGEAKLFKFNYERGKIDIVTMLLMINERVNNIISESDFYGQVFYQTIGSVLKD